MRMAQHSNHLRDKLLEESVGALLQQAQDAPHWGEEMRAASAALAILCHGGQVTTVAHL